MGRFDRQPDAFDAPDELADKVRDLGHKGGIIHDALLTKAACVICAMPPGRWPRALPENMAHQHSIHGRSEGREGPFRNDFEEEFQGQNSLSDGGGTPTFSTSDQHLPEADSGGSQRGFRGGEAESIEGRSRPADELDAGGFDPGQGAVSGVERGAIKGPKRALIEYDPERFSDPDSPSDEVDLAGLKAALESSPQPGTAPLFEGGMQQAARGDLEPGFGAQEGELEAGSTSEKGPFEGSERGDLRAGSANKVGLFEDADPGVKAPSEGSFEALSAGSSKGDLPGLQGRVEGSAEGPRSSDVDAPERPQQALSEAAEHILPGAGSGDFSGAVQALDSPPGNSFAQGLDGLADSSFSASQTPSLRPDMTTSKEGDHTPVSTDDLHPSGHIHHTPLKGEDPALVSAGENCPDKTPQMTRDSTPTQPLSASAGASSLTPHSPGADAPRTPTDQSPVAGWDLFDLEEDEDAPSLLTSAPEQVDDTPFEIDDLYLLKGERPDYLDSLDLGFSISSKAWPQSILWELWDGTKTAQQVLDAARQMHVPGAWEMSVEHVIHHFVHHRMPQPPPAHRLTKPRQIRLCQDLTARQQQIITALWRLRALTSLQVARLLYEPSAKTAAKAAKRAREDLAFLARRHLIYRVFVEDRKRYLKGTGDTIWMLGPQARSWIEQSEGRLPAKGQFCAEPDDVHYATLPHDVAVCEMLVTLAQALGKTSEIAGVPARLHLPAHAWHGPRSTGLAFHEERSGRLHRVQPDAFCAVAIELEGAEIHAGQMSLPKGLATSMLLPMWLEYDRGTRVVEAVAEQIFDYDLLLCSGAAQQRFPELNVKQYKIPMVMVFETAAKTKSVSQHLVKIFEERGQTLPDSPLYVTSRKLWQAGAATGDILALVWDQQAVQEIPAREKQLEKSTQGSSTIPPRQSRTTSVLDMLIAVSAPLIKSRRLDAQSVLTLDSQGGRRLAERRQLMEGQSRRELFSPSEDGS